MDKGEFKALRAKTGLSMEKLAKEIGVSAATVKSWEYGVNKIKAIPEKVIRDTFDRLLGTK